MAHRLAARLHGRSASAEAVIVQLIPLLRRDHIPADGTRSQGLKIHQHVAVARYA